MALVIKYYVQFSFLFVHTVLPENPHKKAELYQRKITENFSILFLDTQKIEIKRESVVMYHANATYELIGVFCFSFCIHYNITFTQRIF